MAQADPLPFWRMNGISKHYGGVRALENVGLTVERAATVVEETVRKIARA